MANLSIDADKLINEAENLKEIAKEYNTLLNEMYRKFDSLSANGAWISDNNGSLDRFLAKVNKDKTKFLALSTTLNTLSEKITNYAKSINEASDDKI